MLNDSSTIIEQYMRNLDGYSIEQLRFKCKENVWSVGQMYIHVIEVAKEYIGHIETCSIRQRRKSLKARRRTE